MAVLRLLVLFVVALGMTGGVFSAAEAKKAKPTKHAAAQKTGKKAKKAASVRKKLRPAKMPKGGVALHKSHRPKAAASSSQLPESAPSEQLPAPVVEE